MCFNPHNNPKNVAMNDLLLQVVGDEWPVNKVIKLVKRRGGIWTQTRLGLRSRILPFTFFKIISWCTDFFSKQIEIVKIAKYWDKIWVENIL